MIKKSTTLLNLTNGIPFLIMITAVALLAVITSKVNLFLGLGLAFVPIGIMLFLGMFKEPYYGFITIFLLNYSIIPVMRYAGLSGLSIFADILILLTIISVILNRTLGYKSGSHFKIGNILTLLSTIWAVYCIFEIVNPTAMTEAWILSRGTAYYMLMTVLITFLTIDNFNKVDGILMTLSVLTLLGFAKGLMQQYLGFDPIEIRELDGGMAKTHLLASGTRYFSFYVSAGIFGAVMGQSLVIFGIASIFCKTRARRIYYIIVALASLYGLLISGTRGALAVPAIGIILFTILSRRIKLVIPTILIAIITYVFLAMTTIGQGNSMIRRARTVFDPNEPSMMVRKENQRQLGVYLKSKPFGEGLGLSGVESQNMSYRFTTTIPTDSWFVKIWVETGIVGLLLHIGILLFVIGYGTYILLFKVKDPYIRGTLSALLCGVAGIIACSYGNMVLGQFPVAIITFMSMALVFMGPYFDKQQAQAKQLTESTNPKINSL